jgi:hypothetical protein
MISTPDIKNTKELWYGRDAKNPEKNKVTVNTRRSLRKQITGIICLVKLEIVCFSKITADRKATYKRAV